MTDTAAAPESAEPTHVADPDEGRYAQMRERFPDDPARAEPDAAPEPEAADATPEREPLPREELESRLNQTKAAMREERARARELKTRLEALEAQEAQRAAQSDPLADLIANLRDDDDDPIGDIETVKKVLKAFREQQARETQTEQQQRQHNQAWTQFVNTVSEHEAEFKEERPDYDQAVVFFRDDLRNELTELGLSGAELDEEFKKRIIGISTQALQKGRNPAEVTYKLAEKRGYRPGGVQATTTSQPQKLDKATERLQTLDKGAKASRSLSSVGGASGDGVMTVERASRLSGKALLNAHAQLREQAKRSGSYR